VVSVAVSVPLDPSASVSAAGERAGPASCAPPTATAAVAKPLLTDAEIVAVPTLIAVTGTATLLCPAAKLALPGTVTTAVLLLAKVTVPAAAGAGPSVTLIAPTVPALSVSGLGLSAVGIVATAEGVVMEMMLEGLEFCEVSTAFT
jgi:hypothetical protein